MSRHLKKSYTDLKNGAPEQSATLTFSLADVKLTEEQIDSIRQEAVKAAIQAAAPFVTALSGPPQLPGDTFSTFSTFSTFGSAVGNDDREARERGAGRA